MNPRIPNSILPALKNQQTDKNTFLQYGTVVGLLMYAMTMTCLALGYALSMVSQYYANLNSTYVAAVIQILRYVHSILHYSLTYTKGQPGFVGQINKDWSGAIVGEQSPVLREISICLQFGLVTAILGDAKANNWSSGIPHCISHRLFGCVSYTVVLHIRLRIIDRVA